MYERYPNMKVYLFYSILFCPGLCPSTAGSSPPPESPIFLCPLLSLSIPLPVAPQCHLSKDVLAFQRICSDNFTCCHTEREVTNQTFHLTQSQYTDTGPTSPSSDPITPGAWQASHWSAIFFLSHWYDSTPEQSRGKRDSNPGSSAPEGDALTTRPAGR